MQVNAVRQTCPSTERPLALTLLSSARRRTYREALTGTSPKSGADESTFVTVGSPAWARRRVMRAPTLVGTSVSVSSPETLRCAGVSPAGVSSHAWLVPADIASHHKVFPCEGPGLGSSIPVGKLMRHLRLGSLAALVIVSAPLNRILNRKMSILLERTQHFTWVGRATSALYESQMYLQ